MTASFFVLYLVFLKINLGVSLGNISLRYQTIINMAKTHTLIVRGVSKEQKNALKRIARKYPVKQSVNQVMLAMISTQTLLEIKEFNNNKK